MVDWLLSDVVKWLLANAVLSSLNALWGMLAATQLANPDVTVLPQVAAITSRSHTVVNVGFVLAIITAGITVMTHQSIQIRYGIADLAPRLVLGFVTSNFATPLCSNLIALANALTRAMTGEHVGSADSFAYLLRVINDALNDPDSAFLLAVIGLILTVLTALLMVSWLVRLGVLIVLVGVAPIALACHATPYTDPVARLWWRSLLGLLATVLLQALALYTTLNIFLRPDTNLPALGGPEHAGTLNLLIVVCLLWAVVRIPGLMRRYVMGTGGQTNVVGLMLRMVMVQPLTRMIPGLGRIARVSAARGASRAGRRGGRGPSMANTLIPYWRPRLPRPTPATGRTATGRTATPARGAAATAAGRPAPRPRIPAGVTPATAMPKTRPAWRGGRPATAASGSPATARRVPAGITPRTAMPATRPAWRATPASAAGPGPAQPRPAVPAGVTPRTAMPATRPAWRTTTAAPLAGGRVAPPPSPRVARGVNPGTAMPRTRPAWRRP